MEQKVSIIAVFPGQGSQVVGMGKDYYEASQICRDTFDEADRALGTRLSRLIFEGPQDQLTQTENAQPALLTVSIAIYRWFKETFNIAIVTSCGHSLGEYSALVATGVLSFGDSLQIVRARGQYMQKAVPLGQGTMAAILGLDDNVVEKICREITGQGLVVETANYNCPGQLVISGTTEGVFKASEDCKKAGAIRVIPLEVSAPFHSSMMNPSGDQLKSFMQEFVFNDPSPPYVANVSADFVETSERVAELLAMQVSKPVLWAQSLGKILNRFKVAPIVEFGPGKVIAGHLKKIDKTRRVLTTQKFADQMVYEKFFEADNV